MTYRCLLFDLDGTLIDSRADLTTSVNLMLGELGRTPLPIEHVVALIGEGVRLLIARALRATQTLEPTDAEIDHATDIFRRHYNAHLLDQTRPYPEVYETLTALRHLPKAVVTNKPYSFSERILEGLDLRAHFAVVIGGDSLPARKPEALPLLEAARLCGHTPDECLMMGDSRIDILAGRAARMKTCGFVPGFRGRAELVEAGADLLIERFGELLRVMRDA